MYSSTRNWRHENALVRRTRGQAEDRPPQVGILSGSNEYPLSILTTPSLVYATANRSGRSWNLLDANHILFNGHVAPLVEEGELLRTVP